MFLTARLFKLSFLLYTEAGRAKEQTATEQNKWLMRGGVETFMNFNEISDARTSLLWFQNLRLTENSRKLLKNLSRNVFLCFASLFREDILCTSGGA